jgi:cell fate (sporulation/competence/biofilm development) regulator YlbF (YheA/YmcA/DUF963 family)
MARGDAPTLPRRAHQAIRSAFVSVTPPDSYCVSSRAAVGCAGTPKKETIVDDNFDEVLKMAGQLGEAIRRHPRYVKLRQADERVRADKAATEALNAYNQATQEIGRKERSGQPIEVADKHRLQRLHEVVAANDTIKAFMRTHADYAELMRRMNDAILKSISAEEGGAVKS